MSDTKEKEQLDKDSCNTKSSESCDKEKMSEKSKDSSSCDQSAKQKPAEQPSTAHKHSGGCSH